MDVVELVDPVDPGRPTAAPQRTRRWGVVRGAVHFGIGVLLLFVALAGFQDVSILVKLVGFCASISLCYAGLRTIGRALWGPRVDVGFWLSMLWLGVLIVAALLADVLPLGEYKDTGKTILDIGNASPDLLSEHPLGTNNFALDLLARSIYGARVSLLTVAFAIAISIIVGGTIGLAAGYFRSWVDTTFSVLTDTVLSVPPLVLLVALASVLGTPTGVADSALKNGAALAVVGTPAMIRLARANSLVYSQREFVLASRAMGARHGRVLMRKLLPNVVLPVVSYSFIIVAVLIVAEGSLAYLGLGLPQPQPTWGNMIAEADLTALREHPHVLLVPASFMFLTVFSFNRVGERARELWDPRDIKA